MLTIQISDLFDSKFMLRYYWTPTPFQMVGEVNDERLSQKAAAFGQVITMMVLAGIFMKSCTFCNLSVENDPAS